MDLIKLIDVAGPKKIKDTLNILIENYENFGDRVQDIADKAAADAAAALTAGNEAKQIAQENTISLEQAVAAQDLKLNNAIAAQDGVVSQSAIDSANAKQIAEEALAMIEQADARSEEATALAEQAIATAEDATATSELAMNLATEAKSTVDQAISTGVFGTFVHNASGISLLHAYMTNDITQEDTEERFYIVTPKAVRDALQDYYSKSEVPTKLELETALSTKLNKTTYQYVKELSESSGNVNGTRYIKIGNIPMSNSNTFIEVKTNFGKRYNGNDDAWKRYPVYELGCFCASGVAGSVGDRARLIESYVQPIGDASYFYLEESDYYTSVNVYYTLSTDMHAVFNIISSQALNLTFEEVDALPSTSVRVTSANATRLAAKASTTSVSTLQTKLNTEISAREAADTALQEDLTSSFNALSEALDLETNNRATTDATLQSAIDAVNQSLSSYVKRRTVTSNSSQEGEISNNSGVINLMQYYSGYGAVSVSFWPADDVSMLITHNDYQGLDTTTDTVQTKIGFDGITIYHQEDDGVGVKYVNDLVLSRTAGITAKGATFTGPVIVPDITL